MKHIIFSLALLAMACTPESEESQGETSSTAGTAELTVVFMARFLRLRRHRFGLHMG